NFILSVLHSWHSHSWLCAFLLLCLGHRNSPSVSQCEYFRFLSPPPTRYHPLAMVIDSHHHFWRYDPARDTWITPEMSVLKGDFWVPKFRAECHSNGIDASIAVQTDQSESDTLLLLNVAEHS